MFSMGEDAVCVCVSGKCVGVCVVSVSKVCMLMCGVCVNKCV